eukprot:gb/GECG01011383.1/.p1 GENE.gb/GECG01011383.1/~~gb/GECG01011383.1/.p1  ORF type:complete len:572 (+),score=75.20 gb/GECG01011383.1/:1-1716(+)
MASETTYDPTEATEVPGTGTSSTAMAATEQEHPGITTSATTTSTSEVVGERTGGAAASNTEETNLREPSKKPEDQGLRIAMIGNVDSGKSTLVGCLTRGVSDDGRGTARQFVFRHRHEKYYGRTSSVGVEVLGFNEDASIVSVDVKGSRQKQFQTVHSKAVKSVTLIDLCGHERYLKTTIFGLTGMLPDYGLVVIGANMGISRMTKEHIGIAAALRLPLIVVVTKIDLAPPDVYKQTMRQLNKVLKHVRKMAYRIERDADVDKAAESILTERITPVLMVSNVTGEGLDHMRSLLRKLRPRVSGGVISSVGGGAIQVRGKVEESKSGSEAEKAVVADDTGPGEVVIDSIFNVPGVGTVVAGTVIRGSISTNSTMLVGPNGVGEFMEVVIRSIQIQYTPAQTATAGGSAAFAIRYKGKGKGGLDKKRPWVKKGMALCHPSLKPKSHWEFEAEVLILHHQTTMCPGYTPIMHCGVVSQAASVLDMKTRDGEAITTMRTGDRAILRCRFRYKPEYVGPGVTLLFREGRAKGVGRVTKVIPEEEAMKAPVGSRHHKPVVFRDYDVEQSNPPYICAS